MIQDSEKSHRGTRNLVVAILLFGSILLVAIPKAVASHNFQSTRQIVSFRAQHSTGEDAKWMVVGNGYCRTTCDGTVDGLDSCDREQTEKYACASAESECQETCANDGDCLAYAFASDPSPESESDAFNKVDTNCKAEGKGRCIFYEDEPGFEVEVSKTTEDRQEYVCTCKKESDGTCEGAALDEVRNKFLMYLIGSIALLVGLYLVAVSCVKCCTPEESQKDGELLAGDTRY